MGMTIEQFKGIEFVRISSFSKAQQREIWASFDPEKIIKIVRDNSLLNDCILSSDFAAWEAARLPRPSTEVKQPQPVHAIFGKLAFE
jgi:hypothetical protein